MAMPAARQPLLVAAMFVINIWAGSGCSPTTPITLEPTTTTSAVSSPKVSTDSPGGAAVAWAQAVLAGDRTAARVRTCAGSDDGEATAMQLVATDVTGIFVGATTGRDDSYSVTLRLADAAGEVQEFTVHVQRIDGTYLIC